MKYSSEQEVFDVVVKHAEQMIEPSFENGRCVYRSSCGNKCLVGALIRDCDYTPSMDDGHGTNVASLLRRDLLPEYLLPFAERLLIQCQNAHDYDAECGDAVQWKNSMIYKLKRVARLNELVYNGSL